MSFPLARLAPFAQILPPTMLALRFAEEAWGVAVHTPNEFLLPQRHLVLFNAITYDSFRPVFLVTLAGSLLAMLALRVRLWDRATTPPTFVVS